MRKILVVALLVSLVGVGAHAETPELSTIQQFKVPKAEGYRVAVSNDDQIVAFYDGAIHNIPDVERYSKLYEHVDQHFVTTKRNVPLHIYIHSYANFVKRMGKHWADSAKQMRKGFAIFTAHTYAAQDNTAIVVEMYQLPLDYTIIHELLHHYMNRIVRDGSLNNEDLITEYAYHLEALFRTTLETDF